MLDFIDSLPKSLHYSLCASELLRQGQIEPLEQDALVWVGLGDAAFAYFGTDFGGQHKIKQANVFQFIEDFAGFATQTNPAE